MMQWLATFSASFLGAFCGAWLVSRRVHFHIKPLSLSYEVSRHCPNCPKGKPSYETLAVELASAREEIKRLVAALDDEKVSD